MPQTYDKQFNSWFDQTNTLGLPSEGLAHLFGEALKSFTKSASKTLNKVTLMAIIKSVLNQSSEKYPVLSKLKVESSGIPLEQFNNQFNQVNPAELTEAFKFLIHELVTIVDDMTADIMQDSVGEHRSYFDKTADRIELLYEISKVLAGFENVEKSFAEIFMILENTFSFQSILLIEKKGKDCVTSIWHNSNADLVQLQRAFNYSRRSYEYLVCPLSYPEVEKFEAVDKHVLPICSFESALDKELLRQNKFITMPLTLRSLQIFGVLQFESLTQFTEDDLRFINALSNLIAVTLDRYNQEKDSNELREVELAKQKLALAKAEENVCQLEKERELREQFVSILTHDLRTPLTSAKMSAQLILKRPENVEKNNVLAGKVVSSIDRMDRMIKDLLDANRIRAGEFLSLSMAPCDMRAIVTMTLKELSVAYGDRFLLETDKESINGFWNEDGIRRVVENLINNAVKYGRPQELISIKLKQIDDSVQIIVHNYGDPISEEDQRNLFQPFHRTNSAKNGEKKGWGLGLTLVRGVAEAHGGNVKVSSSESEGTCFLVTIPKDSRPFQNSL